MKWVPFTPLGIEFTIDDDTGTCISFDSPYPEHEGRDCEELYQETLLINNSLN